MSWRCRNVSGSSVLLIYKCFIARVKLHDVFKLGTMIIPVWLFLFRIELFILLGFLFSSLSSQLLSSPHLTSVPSPPFPYPFLPSPTLPPLPYSLLSSPFLSHSLKNSTGILMGIELSSDHFWTIRALWHCSLSLWVRGLVTF